MNEFSEDNINELKDLKISLENIIKKFNKFKEETNEYINNFEKSFPILLKQVDSYISWLINISNLNGEKDEKVKKNLDFCNNIHDKFIKCNELKNLIYENDYLKTYKELNNIITDICDKYYLSKNESVNSSNNKYNSNLLKMHTNDYYMSFNQKNESLNYSKNFEDFGEYFIFVNKNDSEFNESDFNDNNYKTHKISIEENEDNSIINEKENNIELKCSECKTNKAINICTHCHKYYCHGCSEFILKYQSTQNHILNKIEDSLIEKANLKENFIKNFILFFKHYLIKCNYLLNSEFLSEFALINNVNNFDILNKINQLCPNNESNDENINEIDEKLIKAIITNFKISSLDFDDNIEHNSFLDEKLDLKELEFDNIKNNLFYFITVVSKEKLDLDSEIGKFIISSFSNTLNIDKNNIFILMNDKINNFVKSKNFYELNYTNYNIKNPIFNKLNEMKILSDKFLSELCKIPKNNFDYKGNTLYPNSSNNLMRGKEIYYPPYGWIGIGLNVLGKYENDDWLINNSDSSEWAIAYHGISPKNSPNIIMKLLKYIIIKNDLSKAICNMKSNSNDKRNWGKVGSGIYLIPNIKIAENYTGAITFNNKKYKVILMARVYIKGIREPEHSNFWVLDPKNIRIYRILFKEIS